MVNKDEYIKGLINSSTSYSIHKRVRGLSQNDEQADKHQWSHSSALEG